MTHTDVVGMYDNDTVIGSKTKFPQDGIDRSHFATRIFTTRPRLRHNG